MFKFTATTVINSLTDSSGLAKFAASSDNKTLIARRVGNFKVANIDFAGSVFKNAYTAGVKEVSQLTVAASTLGLVNRLTIDVRLTQKTDSEYANAYLYFRKPVVVEIISSGNTTTDATAFKNAINGLRDRYGIAYITASSTGANLSITATNNNQKFYSIVQEEEVALTLNSNSIIQPEYKTLAGGILNGTTPVNGVVLTTVGVVGFGDDEYMIKAVMLPTYENTRYFGINKEERPIAGGNYTQYTFHYTITKDSDLGIVSGTKSKTTQVFYVLSTLVASFEAILTGLGLTLVAAKPGAGAFKLTGDNKIAVNDTTQLVPEGALGTVTYASATPAVATVDANTGIVTAVSAGSSVITATDSTGSTATLTMTVFA